MVKHFNFLFVRHARDWSWIAAFNLDCRGDGRLWWRVDQHGVKPCRDDNEKGMRGVWVYLHRGQWMTVTQQEAFQAFPALSQVIDAAQADAPQTAGDIW